MHSKGTMTSLNISHRNWQNTLTRYHQKMNNTEELKGKGTSQKMHS